MFGKEFKVLKELPRIFKKGWETTILNISMHMKKMDY